MVLYFLWFFLLAGMACTQRRACPATTEPLAKVRRRNCEADAFVRWEREFLVGGVGRAFRLGYWHVFAISGCRDLCIIDAEVSEPALRWGVGASNDWLVDSFGIEGVLGRWENVLMMLRNGRRYE
jgi:hypothetical protein